MAEDPEVGTVDGGGVEVDEIFFVEDVEAACDVGGPCVVFFEAGAEGGE